MEIFTVKAAAINRIEDSSRERRRRDRCRGTSAVGASFNDRRGTKKVNPSQTFTENFAAFRHSVAISLIRFINKNLEDFVKKIIGLNIFIGNSIPHLYLILFHVLGRVETQFPVSRRSKMTDGAARRLAGAGVVAGSFCRRRRARAENTTATESVTERTPVT